ncbi:hypothetical protein Poly21_16650 [Allorhodopirellula heiligendammensis]|uniref:Uncharacterized protein n=1 Tax=Allorhodopirellula heiligendammensis TaxID=2714739 RepID=A0A5C6C5Z5_9BACT|nr:hypothetical protein Poly21_16650 [Allorhodopirellula heiligendammensis]
MIQSISATLLITMKMLLLSVVAGCNAKQFFGGFTDDIPQPGRILHMLLLQDGESNCRSDSAY